MGIRKNIADHLTAYKTAQGLSERKLAEELNVTLGTIQNCLHMRGNLRLDTLLFLAEQMGISPEEFFLPPDHQQSQQKAALAFLFQAKRILEGVE